MAALALVASGCGTDQPRAALGAERDSVAFAYHGVIEGFYGPPWSQQDRIDILQFMGRVGLEDYFYAAKEDPFIRSRWRDPYPAEEREQLRALITTADSNRVTFWYTLSPGLTMVYADSNDYATLLAKIDSVAGLGASHFGLFLDDVPLTLTHERDRAAFADLADAHVFLINRLATDLEARGYELVVTPTVYTDAWGNPEYLRRLGAGVPDSIPMFWTGVDVSSPNVTAAQAQAWRELTGRPPLLWDNYPVNDFARWRLFLGPLRGRGAALPGALAGIVANPMSEAHASMIPLATLAYYVEAPELYNPDSALARALHDLYDTEIAETLAPIIHVFGDYPWNDNVFGTLHFLSDDIDLAPAEASLDTLRRALRRLRSHTDDSPDVAKLLAEIEPIVDRASRRVETLRSDPRYRREDSHLIFDDARDRFRTTGLTDPIAVDGQFGEWSSAEWHDLQPRTGNQVAFGVDSDHLYIAFRIRSTLTDVRTGARVGEGDHIAIVLDTDPSDARVTPRDLLVLLSPPGGAGNPLPLTRSLAIQGFLTKWLGDNENLTFTEFHISTFGRPPARETAAIASGLRYHASRTANGYDAELAIPLTGRPSYHLSLTVTNRINGRRQTSSLASRNYPFNPRTYAIIRLGDRI